MSLRGNFSSSRLVQLLDRWAIAPRKPDRLDHAERLSAWLDSFDAMRLHSVLQPLPEMPANPSASTALAAVRTATDRFQRVRDAVLQAMAASIGGDGTDDADTTYAPHRKVYLDWQREMEAKATPLRAHVRQTMARVSQPLRQLAMLDAAMEQTLSEREQRLFATVPALLEQRFRHWQRQPPREGWLHAFAQDQKDALLAEWQTRLQPTEGLLQAFADEWKTHP